MKSIKVAIIGYGGIARSHYAAYHRLIEKGFPIDVVAVCDKDTARIFESVTINIACDEVPIREGTHIYSDIDDLLCREDFDMADVCLPTFLHAQVTVKLLRAGKHVLCEKPMALNSAQCEEMVYAARESDRQLMIGQCLRFDPLYLYLKKCVDESTFGSLRYLTMERLCDYPGWASDFKNSEKTGGCILDTHIHDIDIARFLLGEPETASSVVYNNLPHCQLVNTRLFYKDVTVIADVAWDEARPIPFASGYHAKFDDACVICDGEKVTVKPHGKECYSVDITPADRIEGEIRAIAEAILDGKASTVNPPESAWMSVRLIEKMKESAAQNGAIVSIND
ncbi:MAG: Gfo/Idh/MocA family oxidoreductase [Clostridia bacterium]|nr:Gfo/Idh/MocA family oxidoreductase [Clostridia bacterium]